MDDEPIESSPFTLSVITLRPDASRCVVKGSALRNAVARTPHRFEVLFVDAMGHTAHAEDLDVYVKAVEVAQNWEAQAVGFMRHDPTVYDCPVYSTTFRGPTFVFMATLQSKTDTSKRVLSGTALIMQEND